MASPFATRQIPWPPGPPPWHLWGGQETLAVSSLGGINPPAVSSVQLTRVSYKRPDTFQWLFFARLISGPAAGLAEQGAIVVNFDVTVGLGRTSVTIPGFENFSWVWGPSAGIPLSVVLYSTTGIGPNRNFGAVTPVANLIDELVAQDIQVNARVQNNSNFVSNVQLEVASFFAPTTHVRPDWYSEMLPEEAAFAGAELGGL